MFEEISISSFITFTIVDLIYMTLQIYFYFLFVHSFHKKFIRWLSFSWQLITVTEKS